MQPLSPQGRKPKLLDRVRDLLRVKHYSIRTEQSYVDWIKRFIFFHDKRHPLEMGEAEVGAFLTHLAVERKVAASTQNQAFALVTKLQLGNATVCEALLRRWGQQVGRARQAHPHEAKLQRQVRDQAGAW